MCPYFCQDFCLFLQILQSHSCMKVKLHLQLARTKSIDDFNRNVLLLSSYDIFNTRILYYTSITLVTVRCIDTNSRGLQTITHYYFPITPQKKVYITTYHIMDNENNKYRTSLLSYLTWRGWGQRPVHLTKANCKFLKKYILTSIEIKIAWRSKEEQH